VKVPHELRARVMTDLRPVRPFLPAWQRALLLVPAAALVWALAPGLLGIRGDLAAIGPLLAWGGSLVQLVIALVVIGAALKEAVPGDHVARPLGGLLLASAFLVTIALALATNAVSPEPSARPETMASWWFCWKGVVRAGAPLVLLLGVLIARGLPMRPALAGALAGMGAGAAVDGGWRLYCEYSNPAHVIASHGGGVLALTLAGVAMVVTVGHLRQKNRQEDP
jgi:hypothetical protein